MEIIHYPHPTLRYKSQPIKRVDAELRRTVREMFELMYEARGVGLAANQVNVPLRLFVANLAASPDEGEELVFINPVLSRPKGNEVAEEGCLSIPGIYSPVRRPKTIRVNAYNLEGEELVADLDGLFARVVQHEADHLDGVLFVDRISESDKLEWAAELDDFETDFRSRLESVGSEQALAQITAERDAWLARYC